MGVRVLSSLRRNLGFSYREEKKMSEKNDELGLSLSLGLGGNQNPLKLNLFMAPQNNRKTSWNGIFDLSDGKSSGSRSHLQGLDVNAVPSLVDGDDDNGASSPNSTLSSVSGKRGERESHGDENEGERASTSHGSDDEDGNGGGDISRKKLRLSKEQALVLEETFKDHSTLNPKQKQALAKQLNLRPRQVEVWFQNRRARTKLKQTEVDCEYLKRCCENLTAENRRLQKEVQELRALKLSPQLYMHMNPPTTLTMCPSCERVAVSSSSSPAASSSMAGANCQLTGPNLQRAMPMSPWAALPIHRRPFDGQSSQP